MRIVMRISTLIVSILLVSKIFLIQLSSAGFVGGRIEKERKSNKILFVFGDSYADTGNWNRLAANCWKPPYGITFPGKPAGRFSDGRILTDYIASYLNITTPTPYERISSRGSMQSGVNFAFGGTGVFDTDVSQPNMTQQINMFHNVVTRENFVFDLNSSVALVSLAGNDYSNYLKNGSHLKLADFTKSVVKQLVLDLERIHEIGVQKVLVTAMEPLGCLPIITVLSEYKNCSKALNDISLFHNKLLQENVQRLNNNTKQRDNAFYMLDIYGAFMSTLEKKQKIRSGKLLENEGPLKPCCEGITGDFGCGSNEGGQAKYTVCQNPSLAFFWDTVHLTQNGWYQVYNAILPTLKPLF